MYHKPSSYDLRLNKKILLKMELYLFILGLFNDAFNASYYIALNGTLINV
jgi:hypothetical protein